MVVLWLTLRTSYYLLMLEVVIYVKLWYYSVFCMEWYLDSYSSHIRRDVCKMEQKF